ncbi:MAG: GDSL-type esterase/lipase family protein [bacterium]
MKLLCYGDSNTYGFDPRDGGRYPKEGRWPDVLTARFGIETTNEGLNGRTIPYGECGFSMVRLMLTQTGDCDAVCIMLGTNDIFRIWDVTAEKVADRIRKLLANIPRFRRWDEGKRRIILLSPPPLVLPDLPENAAYLRAASELPGAYRKLAGELGIEFFDVAALKPPMAYDGVHLSEEGHRQLAEALGKYLKDDNNC